MISGFVIAYNRAALLPTVLRSIRFVDQLIVIDKSSTDATATIAQQYADQVVTVPWSPTVEETRTYALSLCAHEWIAFLDDDEMFSPAAIRYLAAPRGASDLPVIALPRRNWLFGVFNPDAWYWPEHQCRFFRRGAVDFTPVVHCGIDIHDLDRVTVVPTQSAVYVEHLSYLTVAEWIERLNRYTEQTQRTTEAHPEDADIIKFAHQRLDHWLQYSRSDRQDYPAVLAVLRALYDIVDSIKIWEATQHKVDAGAAFAERQHKLQQAYDGLERLGIRTR